MRQVDRQVQALHRHTRAGLLEGLAHSALPGALAIFHETGRDRPQAATRFDCAPAQQDPVFPAGDTTGDDLGVVIVDGVAGIADMALTVVARRDPDAYRLATMAAIFHFHAGIINL